MLTGMEGVFSGECSAETRTAVEAARRLWEPPRPPSAGAVWAPPRLGSDSHAGAPCPACSNPAKHCWQPRWAHAPPLADLSQGLCLGLLQPLLELLLLFLHGVGGLGNQAACIGWLARQQSPHRCHQISWQVRQVIAVAGFEGLHLVVDGFLVAVVLLGHRLGLLSPELHGGQEGVVGCLGCDLPDILCFLRPASQG